MSHGPLCRTICYGKKEQNFAESTFVKLGNSESYSRYLYGFINPHCKQNSRVVLSVPVSLFFLLSLSLLQLPLSSVSAMESCWLCFTGDVFSELSMRSLVSILLCDYLCTKPNFSSSTATSWCYSFKTFMRHKHHLSNEGHRLVGKPTF